MKYLGISEGFHDAAVAVVNNNQILFATHAERYTGVKNEKYVPDFLKARHDLSIFYEDTDLKNMRRLKNGQRATINGEEYDTFVGHHESHMAAGYYTAPFKDDVVCVVIDAIGEYDTASIWKDGEKVWSRQYPDSLGLFYSAITKRIGLKPNEDEYITMGMAAYGTPCVDMGDILHTNLHKGIPLKKWFWSTPEDIAASAQLFIESEILDIMRKARKYGSKLVYGGGVALNCVANSKIRPLFDDMWIFPSPGDAGSSLGAILAHTKQRIKYDDCFLGFDIERELNPIKVVEELINNKVAGVANGKAEFGPRALGNRSLLGDVRYDIKDTVNAIKRRQKFRPFAPAILEEFVDEYFEGYTNEYMQFVAKAKHDYASVTHCDGTARVQVVKANSKSALRPILEQYYEVTKVPMLLNTSLNIKGQPMVNNWEQALEFEKKYGVKVF
jgi:carbamoyltransferase